MQEWKGRFSESCRAALATALVQARTQTAPWQWSLMETAAMLHAGQASSAELTAACLARVQAANGGPPSFDGAPQSVNAWARLYPELAMASAQAADRMLSSGDPSPLLCGIPLGIKDVIAIAGLPLTASSRVLEGNTATEDSAIWAGLRAHGMVPLGHTHLHEFANGATSDQVGNPFDLRLSAGGSSAGSAAALATGMVTAALGTDTGGSLRVPAALCGVATIKPTYGRVPLAGVIPMAPSRDTAGPMGRTVEDCSVLLHAMLSDADGVPPAEAFANGAHHLPVVPRAGARPLQGTRIAMTDRTHGLALDADVAQAVLRVRELAMALGAEVVDLPAPRSLLSADDLALLLYPEAWAYHRQHVPERLHLYRPAVRDTVEKASRTYALTDYIATRERRDLETLAWDRWMAEQRVDVVLEPTVHYVARPRGRGYGAASGTGSLNAVSLPRQWNILGYPVVAMPVGLGANTGLPVGVSLVARRLGEHALVQAALDLQTALVDGAQALQRRLWPPTPGA
ncbi:amidase [Hydrogenophaga sp.]|uniref:amidase n=1 Tax=Hydrogenophaga sp. TaxID=1904254 RepID=UPI00271800A0|nr:amidase [Hydrogenophaga sp.]MDO9435741.1 amidase [Hydrogenophaga sp.]